MILPNRISLVSLTLIGPTNLKQAELLPYPSSSSLAIKNSLGLTYCHDSYSAAIIEQSYPSAHAVWNGLLAVFQGPTLILASLLAVPNQDIPGVIALTLFEDYVYWTDGKTKSLSRAHKTSGAGRLSLVNSWHAITDIQVYHSYRQPDGNCSLHAFLTAR